uniref:Dihydropteroate synthase n=1 Tax=Schlesneria paludicola TaxID=360056 RepID=A0A7C4QQP9_9PLAN
MTSTRLLFVTGRLAETPLRAVLADYARVSGLNYDVAVLPISVAALMQCDWVARKLTVPAGITQVVLPGWCGGDVGGLEAQWQVPFVKGPKDLFDIPEFLGRGERTPPALNDYSIEILAEINHAARCSERELFSQAEHFRNSGADVIDLGCIPGETWEGIGTATRRLREAGFRVSVDSFNRREVEAAVENGAELVLSAHPGNRDWAAGIPAEWVVIPADPQRPETLDETADWLQAAGRQVRWDPILEPVGYGFAASLERYYAVRRRRPDVPLLMGVGNLTELSEVDSAGVNFLLAALCEELRIGSVLTTEVINWCRSAVQEFDHARRLARYALTRQTLPKHLDGRLLLLRDPKLHELGAAGLEELARRVTDPNFRIFAERGELHIFNRDGYWHGPDPYEVFDRLLAEVGTLTPQHAFYLGMELMKARTALTLGKQYTQDEALRWGFLTVEESSALERRRHESRPP